MKQAANLKDLKLDMLLPGITINTSPTDFYPVKQRQMMKFNGSHWERFGPVIMARSAANEGRTKTIWQTPDATWGIASRVVGP